MTVDTTQGAAIEIHPADSSRLPQVEAALTGGGDGASCWCRWLIDTRRVFDAASVDDRREALRREIDTAATAPGLVATVGGAAAGWVRVGPRPAQPGVLRSRVVRSGSAERADDAAVRAVTCFVVRREHRRSGVAAALLAGAVAHARDHGARVVEGYPVDAAARTTVSSADLWHGTPGLFTRAGFVEIARPTASRLLMRIDLGPAA